VVARGLDKSSPYDLKHQSLRAKPCISWCRAKRGNLLGTETRDRDCFVAPASGGGLLAMTLMEVSEGVLHHSRLLVLSRPFDGLLYSFLAGFFPLGICYPPNVQSPVAGGEVGEILESFLVRG
jgi:hypothetical protein